MIPDDLPATLSALFSELVYGAPSDGAFILNQGDSGLLASLDRISAEAASKANHDGGTIAAHVDHLRYGLSLMNRWADGEENPFADADWSASWNWEVVSEAQWAAIREELRTEADRWRSALQIPRPMTGVALGGVIGSIAHLAYHLGAIRQIDPATRGPREVVASDPGPAS